MKCEIHGVKKIERWVADHGGTKDDKSVMKSDFRYLIRSDSLDHFHQRLSRVIARWSQPFVQYFMGHIAPEIEKFALWTVKKWDFPTTEDSIVTSNQCEHVNRLAAEQQDWIELPVDTAFYIGRDLQKAKLVEIARGMVGLGNFDLLPEYRRKFNSTYGENLLRRIGSTPSYDQILSKYRGDRDLTRHAAFGGVQMQEHGLTLELDSEEIPVDNIELIQDDGDTNANTSVELEEIVRSFDEDLCVDAPTTEVIASDAFANEEINDVANSTEVNENEQEDTDTGKYNPVNSNIFESDH